MGNSLWAIYMQDISFGCDQLVWAQTFSIRAMRRDSKAGHAELLKRQWSACFDGDWRAGGGIEAH